MNLYTFAQTDAIQRYQSNLVVGVETIHMALMYHKFEECGTCVYMNRLELSGLKATSFIVVQRKKA